MYIINVRVAKRTKRNLFIAISMNFTEICLGQMVGTFVVLVFISSPLPTVAYIANENAVIIEIFVDGSVWVGFCCYLIFRKRWHKKHTHFVIWLLMVGTANTFFHECKSVCVFVHSLVHWSIFYIFRFSFIFYTLFTIQCSAHTWIELPFDLWFCPKANSSMKFVYFIK